MSKACFWRGIPGAKWRSSAHIADWIWVQLPSYRISLLSWAGLMQNIVIREWKEIARLRNRRKVQSTSIHVDLMLEKIPAFEDWGKKIFGEQKKSFQIILSLAQNSLRSLCHSKQTLSCWKGTIRSEEQFCSSKGSTTAITSVDELRLSKFKTADFSLYIWIFTYLM